MELNKGTKRKSDFIYELSDSDTSGDDVVCVEPQEKLSKTGREICDLISSDSKMESNLQTATEIISADSTDENVIILDEEVNLESNDAAVDNAPPQQQVNLTTTTVDTTNDVITEDCTNETIEEGEIEDHGQPPCICITFSDNNIAELYKFKFMKFIQSFVELEVISHDGLSININRDTVLSPTEWVVLDDTIDLKSNLETPGKKRKKKPKKELFTLDTNPSLTSPQNTNNLKYNSKFLIDNKSDEKEVKEKNSGLGCFNCGKNHSLRDCPEEKDIGRINAARQKFKTHAKPPRYHVDEDLKYGHLKPGKISDKLREAMGLHKSQLPAYIYYMRILGYPPGWLEEAKLTESNLSLFDIDGKNVKSSSSSVRQPGLDVDKIIEYPGFNAPAGKGFKDEYRMYNTPAYSDGCNKKAMIDYYEKVRTSVVTSSPEPEVAEESNGCSNSSNEEEKESLKELEQQKQALLAELQNSKQPISIEITEDVNTSMGGHLSPVINTNAVKTSSFGTPILKSSSPYSRLPNPDNFMKDVSPVINFENLPNSTGKYEQMSGVIQRVRSTMKNLQKCK